MPPKIKVAVFGATGRSASTIIDALLESPSTFEITAFSRPCSLNKPRILSHRSRGIHVLPYDLKRPHQETLVSMLKSFDVVISALSLDAILDQIPLASIAKAAGVGRFVPSMYAPCVPAVGVEEIRDMKEEVINHVKKIGLGYTVIDVGSWYESYVFDLHSSRSQYARPALSLSENVIPGTGDVSGAMTSFRDVGRWVARIIADPRTLNRMVFAYGDVLTPNQAYDAVERITGMKIGKNQISEDHLVVAILEARAIIKKGDADEATVRKLRLAQNLYACGVRGDNTPWTAKYLGYVDARELYPDFKPISFVDFVRESMPGRVSKLHGRAISPYSGQSEEYGNLCYDTASPEIRNCPAG